MYTSNQLAKMAFFDLETAPEYKSLGALAEVKPKMAELWSKRCEYLRSHFKENEEKTDEELYENKAALHPEFMRIVCASFGRIDFKTPTPTMTIKSFSGADEDIILEGIIHVFEKFEGWTFTGHNIEKFDIPVMCKRLLIKGFKLPSTLMVHDKKPWETSFADTSKLWSFGAWQQGFTSLELLTTSLGLESPKDDIKGADVGRVFWEDSDHSRIATYCEKDVYALAQVLLQTSGLALLDGYNNKA